MAGFTTVRNLGAAGYSVIAVRDGINAGEIPGPRIKAAIRAGIDSIEHCSFMDDEAIQLALKCCAYLSCDIYNTEYTLAFGEANGVTEDNINKDKWAQFNVKVLEKQLKLALRWCLLLMRQFILTVITVSNFRAWSHLV
ncbi:MAG: imidazolonepropionase-like amidohydrolase [Glaciecola sp.]